MNRYTPFRYRPIRVILIFVPFCTVFLAFAMKVHRRRATQYATLLQANSTQSDPHLHALDIWNRHRITYDPLIRAQFERLVTLKPASDAEDLVRLVKTLLDPPANHPVRKTVHTIFQTPQAKHVDSLFKGQRGLFFVEAGGLDGERSSNTLWLEEMRGWRGLLVEADPFYYTQLRGKARRSYSLNACLGGKLEALTFQECIKNTNGGCGHLKNSTSQSSSSSSSSSSSTITVPCFSLETMMLALNRSSIDYMSLDVEGHERAVLDAIPWTRITIKVINIEYVLFGEKRAYTAEEKNQVISELNAYMKKRGYKAIRRFDERIPEKDLYSYDMMYAKEDIHFEDASIT